MQSLIKAAVFALGLAVSGTAIANNNFGGSPLYNPQYSYRGSLYYYSAYPRYWNYSSRFPNYYTYYNHAYPYPYYGWCPGTGYLYWDPTAASHPYSKTNPNWIPYVGWR